MKLFDTLRSHSAFTLRFETFVIICIAFMCHVIRAIKAIYYPKGTKLLNSYRNVCSVFDFFLKTSKYKTFLLDMIKLTKTFIAISSTCYRSY
jgi:hypothetical protein